MNQASYDSIKMALVHLHDAQRRMFFTPDTQESEVEKAHQAILMDIIKKLNVMVKNHDTTA